MTAADLRAALAAIGWSARQIAAATGRAESAGPDWTAGRRPIPPEVAAWVAAAAAWHRDNPVPRKPQTRSQPPIAPREP
jgi:hypothetical protein